MLNEAREELLSGRLLDGRKVFDIARTQRNLLSAAQDTYKGDVSVSLNFNAEETKRLTQESFIVILGNSQMEKTGKMQPSVQGKLNKAQ